MQEIDVIFFILPFILFKSIDDYKCRKIISKRNNSFSNCLYFLHIFLLILLIILILFVTLSSKLLTLYSIIKILFLLVLIIFFLKRANCIFNETLEFHYEGLVYLTLASLIFGNYNSALIISSCILISSLSAGISKLNCSIWKPNGDGFLRFLILPWSSRRIISKISSKFYKKNKGFRLSVNIIQIFVPWIQIISALFLFYFKFVHYNFFGIILALIIQVSFALILFLIADLSWIPFFYIWLVYVFSLIPITLNNNYLILFFENLSITFVLIYFFRVFFNIRKNFLRGFYNYFSILSLPNGPFEMFTERNIDNIITHYIRSDNNLIQFNAFDKNGLRFRTQNLSSRHLFCTLYTLGDFLVLNSDEKLKREDFKFKSLHNKRQCLKIFKAIKNGDITFFQHVWDKNDFSFQTKRIAILKIKTDYEDLTLSLINYSKIFHNKKRRE